MPVPKLSALESRTIQAPKRLKVKPEELITCPQITKMIKSTVKGGLKVALDAMRWSDDDTEIAAFLKVYDKVPVGDRSRVPWEAIAIAAKVNTKHLLGSIQFAVGNHCMNKSRFIVVSNQPYVTKARVEFALAHVGAEKDRTALDISSGMLPSPKGPTFIGKQVAVFGGTKDSGQDDDDGKTVDAEYTGSNDGFDSLFPSPNDIQDKLVPIRQRLLEG